MLYPSLSEHDNINEYRWLQLLEPCLAKPRQYQLTFRHSCET